MKILKRIAVAVVVFLVIAYLGVLVAVYALQRDLQYFPNGEITPLEELSLARAQTIRIQVGDGEVVNGWYAPPQSGMPVIVYYKGNYGSFSAEHERFAAWLDEGYGFVAFDYRGFPLSPGAISEDAILSDSVEVFDWAREQGGSDLMIWGRSLGTGPATYVASLRDAEALLLETPFLSAVQVAAERYPFLPVHWLMQDQFPSNQWISDVEEPVLVAHGTADTTIDVSNGRRLYDLAPNPDELWIAEGADHSGLWDVGLWEQAREFFARY
ncbi:alpha/beta hydrolase [Devosia pacifica]|uniref:Alpha/beta hydrolase n=1 Tax=Devosia pacifica TaxID=1335967 RepID=A0A918VZP2_9HYPH|nr:alpha/beta hydrolase [Devosia pacifica]GHA38158.1 alpha/beta hydrolase [Devosia pacifica]